jgi:uncharacterized protein YyaL (SSP411 family)
MAILEWITDPVDVVFTGANASENLNKFHQRLYPFVLIAASTSDSELPLLKGRFATDSPIYVCRNRACDVPVYRLEDIRI